MAHPLVREVQEVLVAIHGLPWLVRHALRNVSTCDICRGVAAKLYTDFVQTSEGQG
jgi:hypothetical protein